MLQRDKLPFFPFIVIVIVIVVGNSVIVKDV